MKRPWMPLYVNDFLSDTRDLEPDQFGIYFLLLILSWQRKDAALPNDMKWLKRSLSACVADMHGNRFNRLVPPLLNRYFVLDTDGMWRNPRLVYEREKSEKFSEKQKQNAEKRWAKTNNINNLGFPNAMPARARQSQSHIESSTTEYEDARKKPSNGIEVSSELQIALARKGWV